MALLWTNPATNNRFAAKHLMVIPGSPTLQTLVDEGYKVFDARVKAWKWRRKKTPQAQQLKATYGSNVEVTSNTLIVLTIAGLAGLDAMITNNGYQSGWYKVQNGVVFTMDDDDYEVGLVADLKLAVRAVSGGGYEVWHLDGANISVPLRPSAGNADSQTKVAKVPEMPGVLGLRYAPTSAELINAMSGLKHVITNTSNTLPPPSEIGNVKLIDLSFLDDD